MLDNRGQVVKVSGYLWQIPRLTPYWATCDGGSRGDIELELSFFSINDFNISTVSLNLPPRGHMYLAVG